MWQVRGFGSDSASPGTARIQSQFSLSLSARSVPSVGAVPHPEPPWASFSGGILGWTNGLPHPGSTEGLNKAVALSWFLQKAQTIKTGIKQMVESGIRFLGIKDIDI